LTKKIQKVLKFFPDANIVDIILKKSEDGGRLPIRKKVAALDFTDETILYIEEKETAAKEQKAKDVEEFMFKADAAKALRSELLRNPSKHLDSGLLAEFHKIVSSKNVYSVNEIEYELSQFINAADLMKQKVVQLPSDMTIDEKLYLKKLTMVEGYEGFKMTGSLMLHPNSSKIMNRFTTFSDSDTTTFHEANKSKSSRKTSGLDVGFAGLLAAFGLPDVGVGVGFDKCKNSTTGGGKTNQSNTKSKELVACFDVVDRQMCLTLDSVTLNEGLKKEAILIGQAKGGSEKQQMMGLNFLSKVPRTIMTGPFSIGCWSRTTVKATSKVDFDSEEIYTQASTMAKTAYKAHIGGGYADIGAKVSGSNEGGSEEFSTDSSTDTTKIGNVSFLTETKTGGSQPNAPGEPGAGGGFVVFPALDMNIKYLKIDEIVRQSFGIDVEEQKVLGYAADSLKRHLEEEPYMYFRGCQVERCRVLSNVGGAQGRARGKVSLHLVFDQ
jgi:hypothetical protein